MPHRDRPVVTAGAPAAAADVVATLFVDGSAPNHIVRRIRIGGIEIPVLLAEVGYTIYHLGVEQ